MELQNRISINPKICHGQPCVKGARIMVTNILAALAEGLSFDEIITEFPEIVREDILTCIDFANDVLNEKTWLPEAEPIAAA